MRTDGIFDYKVIEAPVKYNEPFNIIFMGDEHFNSHNFAADRWHRDLDDLRELAKRERTYFIKMGDVFEAMSTSERHAFSNSALHESNKTRWEREYAREIEEYYKHVKFMTGKTLAVFGGNHFFKFFDGTTSDMVLANKLEAPYIGVCGYVILSLRADKYHCHELKIFVHHGTGSGQTAGSSFNGLERAANYFPDADIVMQGHNHMAGAMQLPRITCSKGKGDSYRIREDVRIIGRTGSYLKSYESRVPSYAVDNLYRPSTLGYLHVIANVRRKSNSRKNEDDRWLQLNAKI